MLNIPTLIVVLISCQLSFCAEINIPQLFKHLRNENVNLQLDNKEVGNALKNFDKSNFGSIIPILQPEMAKVRQGLRDIANQFVDAINTLKKYNTIAAAGNTYIPNDLYQMFKNGLKIFQNGFENLAVLNKNYVENIIKNTKYFGENSSKISYPLNFANNDFQLRNGFYTQLLNLAENCLKLANVTKKIANYQTNHNENPELFKKETAILHNLRDKFNNLATDVQNWTDDMKAIETVNSQKKKASFSLESYILLFDDNFNKIGGSFSDLTSEFTLTSKSLVLVNSLNNSI